MNPEWLQPNIEFARSGTESIIFFDNKAGVNFFYADYYALLDYFPKNRYGVVPGPVSADRSELYHFKDGAAGYARLFANKVCSAIINQIPQDERDEWTSDNTIVSVLPASTGAKTTIRFRAYCRMVAEKLDVTDGFHAITNKYDVDPAHLGKKARGDISNLAFNGELINGKRVLLLDDITTSRSSFKAVSEELFKHGATHVTGFYAGKTFDSFRNPEPAWVAAK